jgi:hypothetical protein
MSGIGLYNVIIKRLGVVKELEMNVSWAEGV